MGEDEIEIGGAAEMEALFNAAQGGGDGDDYDEPADAGGEEEQDLGAEGGGYDEDAAAQPEGRGDQFDQLEDLDALRRRGRHFASVAKDSEDRNRMLQSRFAQLQQAVNRMLEQQTPQPAAAGEGEEPPSRVDEPLERLFYELDSLKRQITSEQERQHAASTQERQVQVLHGHLQAAEGQIEAYRQARPDYDQAIHFAIGKALSLERRLAPHLTDQELEASVGQKIQALKLQARAQGLDAGELFYNLAMDYGWQGMPAPAANGHAAPAPGTTHAQRRVQQLRQRQQAARTPATLAPGGTGRQQVDLSRIGDLSPEQFDALMVRLEKEGTADPLLALMPREAIVG